MAKRNDELIHCCFELKPSRLALVFQCSCLLIILFCVFHVLPIWLWLISIFILVLIYFIFLKQVKVNKIELLDHNEWSIQYNHVAHIQRSKISKMIDHKIYVVIYLQDQKIKPLVIWQDQISKIKWKSLKTRAKLT